MATTTSAAPAHAALITALRNSGWNGPRAEPSALITGLSVTTLTAPVGELTVRIESVGAVAMLTLSANAPEGMTETRRYYVPWRASAPVVPARMLDKIARASEEARQGGESGADEDELIRHLKPKGWKHTEERSHDELLWGLLASPDGTRQITWGSDFETWRVTDHTEHTVITTDDCTPIAVLRVMAGVD
jgi:hypothetical protein